MFNAQMLAEELMVQHGLQLWKFKFSRGLRTCGYCCPVTNTISLSTHYVSMNAEELIRNTVLHEIAHALVGCQHGHNAVWKAKCREIGCQPERLNHDAEMPKGKFRAVCGGCGYTSYAHRLKAARREGRVYCVKCGPTIGQLFYRENNPEKSLPAG